MKVIGINGSPRIGGNNDLLLDKALEGAKAAGAEIEKLHLNTINFRGCQECADALTNGNCKVMDDMQGVLKKVIEADAVIIASPIFFGSVTGQLKCMIDRFQCYWMGKYTHKTVKPLSRKRGAFICVQGTDKESFFLNAKSVIKNFFATIDADYKAELSCMTIDRKAEVLEHPELLDKAFRIGKKIV